MISRLINFFRRMYNLLEVTKGLSRGAGTKNYHNIRSADPMTWEFSGFSQNGEDGLLDYLIHQLKVSDKPLSKCILVFHLNFFFIFSLFKAYLKS